MIAFANFDLLKRYLSGRELSLNAYIPHYTESQPLILFIFELHTYLSYVGRCYKFMIAIFSC